MQSSTTDSDQFVQVELDPNDVDRVNKIMASLSVEDRAAFRRISDALGHKSASTGREANDKAMLTRLLEMLASKREKATDAATRTTKTAVEFISGLDPEVRNALLKFLLKLALTGVSRKIPVPKNIAPLVDELFGHLNFKT